MESGPVDAGFMARRLPWKEAMSVSLIGSSGLRGGWVLASDLTEGAGGSSFPALLVFGRGLAHLDGSLGGEILVRTIGLVGGGVESPSFFSGAPLDIEGWSAFWVGGGVLSGMRETGGFLAGVGEGGGGMSSGVRAGTGLTVGGGAPTPKGGLMICLSE